MPVEFDKESQAKLDAIQQHEEEELITVLSQKYGLTHTNLADVPISVEALRLIPEKVAHNAEVVAFQKKDKEISVGIRTPNNPLSQQAIHNLEERGYEVETHMVSRASLEHAWVHYKDITFAVETESGVLDVSSDEIRKLLEELTSLVATREAIEKVLGMKKIYRITRMLEIIIAGAVANGTSDIHLEPENEQVRLRFRLDGVLADAAKIDPETYKAVLIRVKLLSGLKINIHEAAQDGRFSVRLDDRELDIRTSILPSGYGESIVLRILDPRSLTAELGKLGMRSSTFALLEEEISKPNGMIVNTGPTGSGKTTTLYALLKRILDPGTKILTIEDPIEYHLEGIVQTQVNHKSYTFASGLRSALRQDPDVIMVGEIRDNEVATTAIEAALTGHLVFSTLHTNNAVGAFPRLIDLGIDPSVIGSAVNLVMAQRLLRTLDPEKRREVPIESADRTFIEDVLEHIHDRSLVPDKIETMWVPDVPEGEREYHGRVGVYETVTTTREIEDGIRKRLTIRELEDVAREQGMLTLREDAILKVLEGITTLDEVRRVLGDSFDSSA